MKVAIEGCCHGELDGIYEHIGNLEKQKGYKVDLLLICGDFQAIRNRQDLQSMAVPDKYKQLGQFHKYYTGEKEAPMLTIVIGGNHEASNYMWELYHGGWLAPNIYFLGHAGCVKVGGVRIAGASGIFNGQHFHQGSYERAPLNSSTMRSIYHIREFCVRRLSLLSSPRIFLSHDWPQSIEHHGDLRDLLRRKKFLREDVETGRLGSPPLMGLLQTLKPEWWFSAHLHTRFEATVSHGYHGYNPAEPNTSLNPEEINIDEDDMELMGEEVQKDGQLASKLSTPLNSDEIIMEDEQKEVASAVTTLPSYPTTRFLALDKCLPRRQFLEVIDLPIDGDSATPGSKKPCQTELEFDPEWLAITRAFQPWFSTIPFQRPFPAEAEAREMVEKELEWVTHNIKRNEEGMIPISDWQTFAPTAPGGPDRIDVSKERTLWYSNPQTEALCRMLDMENRINPPSDPQ